MVRAAILSAGSDVKVEFRFDDPLVIRGQAANPMGPSSEDRFR